MLSERFSCTRLGMPERPSIVFITFSCNIRDRMWERFSRPSILLKALPSKYMQRTVGNQSRFSILPKPKLKDYCVRLTFIVQIQLLVQFEGSIVEFPLLLEKVLEELFSHPRALILVLRAGLASLVKGGAVVQARRFLVCFWAWTGGVHLCGVGHLGGKFKIITES